MKFYLKINFSQNKVGLDEDNEATLLTALTEILDNVDNENLSPFDTLPDSDLLTGQKGREHSPVSPTYKLNLSLFDMLHNSEHVKTDFVDRKSVV